jgi:hypothetical protein
LKCFSQIVLSERGEKLMPRISGNNPASQRIPVQQSATTSEQKVKLEDDKKPDLGAKEQHQNKSAAQGRKSEMDLQGTMKKTELAQFRHLGGCDKRIESQTEKDINRMKKDFDENLKELERAKKRAKTPEEKKAIEVLEDSVRAMRDNIVVPNEQNAMRQLHEEAKMIQELREKALQESREKANK